MVAVRVHIFKLLQSFRDHTRTSCTREGVAISWSRVAWNVPAHNHPDRHLKQNMLGNRGMAYVMLTSIVLSHGLTSERRVLIRWAAWWRTHNSPSKCISDGWTPDCSAGSIRSASIKRRHSELLVITTAHVVTMLCEAVLRLVLSNPQSLSSTLSELFESDRCASHSSFCLDDNAPNSTTAEMCNCHSSLPPFTCC